MKIIPLDTWTMRKIGSKTHINRDKLQEYQLKQLKKTLIWVKRKSPFYRRHLKSIQGEDVKTIKDVSNLPFTTADELCADPNQFLCVHPDSIKRIVTLPTSGTTGVPKRIFFTKEDQELTVDFFHNGMKTLVSKGDRVLILLSGKSPGSVGDLLKRGLARDAITGIVNGPMKSIADLKKTMDTILQKNINSIAGSPVQVLALARYSSEMDLDKFSIKSVLLSTDYASNSIVRIIENIWDCKVFDHYGMTEMGLGGGVQCLGQNGYHLREADLLFEIVDLKTGKPVLDGEFGEVVFTTLTRKGMPLIRYRTGDISRFIPQSCSCTSVLKRLEQVSCRLSQKRKLASGEILTVGMLDEAIFSIENIIDFKAQLIIKNKGECLYITVYSHKNKRVDITQIYLALNNIPAINKTIRQDKLTILVKQSTNLDDSYSNFGVVKRSIEDLRNWR